MKTNLTSTTCKDDAKMMTAITKEKRRRPEN